ncbi:N-lysine methyltransferase KMT5A-like isoform X1 [Mya arenaria]|uniref:N-lysine methyltransferase KMT5A-like isoform X1 n=1 Tax=Mya arenaria TaxID=6604 RepID=UPI0022E3951C|nr:N-lysine methyltransferase KMT5A-like isoform X1 [Mya arenaria]
MRPTARLKPIDKALYFIKLDKDQDGYTVKDFGFKGRGIKTIVDRKNGDFLLHYTGELITGEEGDRREAKNSTGFRFFFISKGKQLCVDASEESGRLGRLVNHGHKKELNAVMKEVSGQLILFAQRDICAGEELLYDYGLKEYPWTQVTVSTVTQMRPMWNNPLQLQLLKTN